MAKDQRPEAAALRYEKGKDSAPRLVAKGQGHIAAKILQLAKDNQIPVHEDPALIEILSKMNLDEQIPGDCYRVVAEILAWIYKAKLQATAKGRLSCWSIAFFPSRSSAPQPTDSFPARTARRARS
jgi:flagellar biosynthesis protein